jgi:hypothetical protein
MPHKFFYSWQSERPTSICRTFIRTGLDNVSTTLNQSGIDERVEIDSDTQGVPGTPEIFSTILAKIEAAAVFIADLTICAETAGEGNKRLYPNSNVMFEYGYALRAKTRGRLICVMNTFYGGSDPTQLPFDLRHARAPIRFLLSPDAKPDERKKVFERLCDDLLVAARLIVDNLPGEAEPASTIEFQGPHFKEGQEVASEGDYYGEINPTLFGHCPGFIYLRGLPLRPMNLNIAQIGKFQRAAAGLEISDSSRGGSHGTNKWGRVSYAIEPRTDKRITCDYVQYFRSGEIEIVNGSYLRVISAQPIHLNYLITKLSEMLAIMKEWMEKINNSNWLVELGIVGVEKRRLTNSNFGTGPLLHQDKISVRKKVDPDSVLLLAEEMRLALLAEVGA